MADAATVVGINRTQDGSVCLARGPSTVYILGKERLTRRKHHWGRLGDVTDLYLPALAALKEPVDLVAECYSSDDEIANVDAYRGELEETLLFRDGMRGRKQLWDGDWTRPVGPGCFYYLLTRLIFPVGEDALAMPPYLVRKRTEPPLP
jgi:hypothetical protein